MREKGVLQLIFVLFLDVHYGIDPALQRAPHYLRRHVLLALLHRRLHLRTSHISLRSAPSVGNDVIVVLAALDAVGDGTLHLAVGALNCFLQVRRSRDFHEGLTFVEHLHNL